MACNVKTACREGCGACCIAPSIHSPLSGMPEGKPAGVPCIHLDAMYRCDLFNKPERPSFCGTLPPSHEMCGDDREEAMAYLTYLEEITKPEGR